MKTHYLFFLFLLSLFSWPILSSSNIRFQDPVSITGFSDLFNKNEEGEILADLSNTSSLLGSDGDEEISDTYPPSSVGREDDEGESKDGSSENLGTSFLHDGKEAFSITSRNPSRRSLLSLPK